MQKTHEILQAAMIKIDPMQQLKLAKVEVDVVNQQWYLQFEVDFLVTSDYYSEIVSKLNVYFRTIVRKVHVCFKIKNSQIKDQTISSVIDFYQLYLAESDNQRMKKIRVSIEGNFLVFHLNSPFEETMAKKSEAEVKSFFIALGITVIDFKYQVKQVTNMEANLSKAETNSDNEVFIKVKPKSQTKILFGDDITGKKALLISDIVDPNNMVRNCVIEAKIFSYELRKTPKSHLLILSLVDESGTITAKSFLGYANRPPLLAHFEALKENMTIKIAGRKEYDKYAQDDSIMIESCMILDSKDVVSKRNDLSETKRVEMHVHTKMSKNNGIHHISQYAKLAKHFGHDAIAITDHNIVQGFVDAEKVQKATGMKIIYGSEVNVVQKSTICFNATEQKLEDITYTIFDLETTGLSANFNDIIEIGAVKMRDNAVIDQFQCFIKIDSSVSEFITSLTGITDNDLQGGIDIKDGLERFLTWSKDTVLVAHNAIFDMQFLARNYEKHLGLELTQPVVDTLELSRLLNVENTFHSLKILARKYQVQLDSNSHHRADYDAQKLSEIFIGMQTQIAELEITSLNELNTKNNISKNRGKHNLLYVKNQAGLKDMYQLVSNASTNDYHQEPRFHEADILALRENLIYVGGGCPKSQIVDAYLNQSKREIEKLISQFDYIEVLPPQQYSPLVMNGSFTDMSQVHEMICYLIDTAKKYTIDIFASGNVHYSEPEQYMYKEILIAKDFKPEKVKKDELGTEVFIDKIKFKKYQTENMTKNKSQYFKTTDEMLADFSFLDPDVAKYIVCDVPNQIKDSVDVLKIVPDELFTPEIKGIDEKLTKMVYQRAYDIYGQELPEIIIKRLEKEVNAITKYGFSIIYYISHKLVKHSLDHGYLVGSRGSVGSSLVATFMDITEINPLAPHYVCPTCKESHFITDGSVGSGYDLSLRNCEKCDILMIRDGQDIPFETFLGFEGDKVPDIDLNFSGEFQGQAHEFVRSKDKLDDDELFDFDHAFRAGTIGTIADKTAYAYVKNYFDLIDKPARRTDVTYMLRDLVGIKRTTGQHPGGIIVVPPHRSIYEFTPIQFPADDIKQPWKTTHFDFHSIHDNLLKLDILGHDDPTMLKKLFDSTGIDPKYVNITDEKVMQLFSSTESLGVASADILNELGTQGVPEFGTGFVQEMLKDTRPSTFAELVQISGLSHGTDVWLGNAKVLIDNDTCELKEVIGCRDDIMVYLMYQGLNPKDAFVIMENVRKGKGLKPEEITIMKEKKVPDWYIESCQKIKYMFPKAHAAAYVLMALRIAYFKVYHPLNYYAAYFSSRIDDFDAHSMVKGKDALKNKIEIINSFDGDMSEVKKKSLLNSLKMCLEMVVRGFDFIGFDITESESHEFKIDFERGGLILPFNIIDGLGEKEALKIVEERAIKPFSTKEDFKKRTRVKAKTFDQLEFFNVFNNLEDDNQITLF